MQDKPFPNDKHEIRDLLKQFDNLRSGLRHTFSKKMLLSVL